MWEASHSDRRNARGRSAVQCREELPVSGTHGGLQFWVCREEEVSGGLTGLSCELGMTTMLELEGEQQGTFGDAGREESGSLFEGQGRPHARTASGSRNGGPLCVGLEAP